jgi:glycosyltransferase involved in cell wall biosynthesis
VSTDAAPDVSVILIVRNGERFIADALASVIRGTLRPAEILVIDGHSSDRTAEIVRTFEGVTLVRQDAQGIASAYNQGIVAGRGGLVSFISHDDHWLPEKLERQVAFMRAHPQVQYTVTHVQYVLHGGASPPAGFRTELLDRPVPGFIMECLMARREVFARIGPFDSSFAICEDTDWFARARDAHVPMAVLPETLVIKRVHDTNASLSHPQTSALLLRAMRRSVERKRAAADDR